MANRNKSDKLAGRSRRSVWDRIPFINYQEHSSEEEYDSAEDDNELVSPKRPHKTPEHSPAALLVPDPPHTDEVLEEVQKKLEKLPEVEISEEGFIAGEAEPEVAEGNANGHIMPNIVNFEDENGVDGAGALKDRIQAVAKINWDDNDLKYFQKVGNSDRRRWSKETIH